MNTVSTTVDPLEGAPVATLERPLEAWADEDLFEDELLVEEISIDGMCGVY